jgi:hypothetical protein
MLDEAATRRKRHGQRRRTGLVQQTVQIVAALRLHDLTLFVTDRPHLVCLLSLGKALTAHRYQVIMTSMIISIEAT